MDRLAYVDLPAFPLQILLRDYPDFRDRPAVVVEHDRPQGVILWANERARQRFITSGMSYAQGLAMDGDLRAATMADSRIRVGIFEVLERLRVFTPAVEPHDANPGGFWLDASGLNRLEISASHWARKIHRDLHEAGWDSRLVVGFDRFHVFAAARAFSGGTVFTDPEKEAQVVEKIPLDRLPIEPADLAQLIKLGVTTLGDFRNLPANGVARRFAESTRMWHRRFSGLSEDTFHPAAPEDSISARVQIPDGEDNTERLLFPIKNAVQDLVAELAERYLALSVIETCWEFAEGGDTAFSLKPAEPTLEVKLVVDLLRLRLESMVFPSPVVDFTLTVQGEAATRGQLEIFQQPVRDLAAADRALARLRAQLGEDAVVTACLQNGHCPESGFRWSSVHRVTAPRPIPTARRTLVRRIFPRPLPLPDQPMNRNDGWVISGERSGAVVATHGPYLVNGGWWRKESRRRYFYVETRSGDLWWVYFDELRNRWFAQGMVE